MLLYQKNRREWERNVKDQTRMRLKQKKRKSKKKVKQGDASTDHTPIVWSESKNWLNRKVLVAFYLFFFHFCCGLLILLSIRFSKCTILLYTSSSSQCYTILVHVLSTYPSRRMLDLQTHLWCFRFGLRKVWNILETKITWDHMEE